MHVFLVTFVMCKRGTLIIYHDEFRQTRTLQNIRELPLGDKFAVYHKSRTPANQVD